MCIRMVKEIVDAVGTDIVVYIDRKDSLTITDKDTFSIGSGYRENSLVDARVIQETMNKIMEPYHKYFRI
jgi:polynucleotide 5'-kinase involved in rRNA processing